MANENDLVTLCEFHDITNAEIVKSMLESNGIPAMVTDQINPFGTVFTMSKVRVFQRDYEAAKQLLDENEINDPLDV